MTVTMIIEQAAQLGGWMISDGGAIRRRRKGLRECPITAIANSQPSMYPYDVNDWRQAAEFLRLPLDVAEIVVRAADNRPKTWQEEGVRVEMLKRFGLPAF
jgi:hypothetical protein